MKNTTYDVAIIGSGPGGYVCAIRLAQLGKRVVIIEKNHNYGGTCLNVGCIPSKALLHASLIYENSKYKYSDMGIETNSKINLQKMHEYKEGVVQSNTNGIKYLFKKNKIETINGFGEIINSNEILIKNEDSKITINATTIILATGSVPNRLNDIEIDEKNILSSTGALSLDRIPKNLIIVGAGYIGIELGSVWMRLGSKVKFIEYSDKILPETDQEAALTLKKNLEKKGMEFMLNKKLVNIDKSKNGLTIFIEDAKSGQKEDIKADVVLLSIGRKPNTEGLGIENVGIETDSKGRIHVDKNFKTNISNVYAIGDVIKGPMLAHKAEEEAVAVAEIISGKYGHVNYSVIPSVIYSEPEIASVGLTEEELKNKKIDYSIGKFPFIANGRAKVNQETDGFVKILADKLSDKVLGVHIIGSDAGTLIGEAAIAMEFGASSEDIALTCHAHPTLNESIKEAALDVNNRAIHI